MCNFLELFCPCMKKTEDDFDIIPEEGEYHGEFDFTRAKHGFGIYRFRNGDMYEGYWKKDKKHGLGEYRFKNGEILNGYFENDKFMGKPPKGMESPARSNSPQPMMNEDIKSAQKPVKVNQNQVVYSFAKTVSDVKHHIGKKQKKHKGKDERDSSRVVVDERENLIHSQPNPGHGNYSGFRGQTNPQAVDEMERQRQIRYQEQQARYQDRVEKIRKKYNIPVKS